MDRRHIGETHEAPRFLGRAVDIYGNLHRASPLERAEATLHSLAMYARDTARIATPVGIIAISGDDALLHAITIGEDGAEREGDTSAVRLACHQLQAWFAGTLTHFSLPLAPSLTPRGQALREAMLAIGYGETVSYGTLAKRAESSARAIGQACARNPFPIVVPCHRVLDASGRLGAYSAGEGPATKRWLLDFEQRSWRGLLL
ncbi:methylated-DNA--[protein]-cysteine S-methyltransferase [Sphingomonas sp. RB3P16]|uniref:methylated-DNA--[protein]-cysteine S-methyltransferase n=1 Tax=Parasphingomonas frigoris TaxID=3096163 RepID=UPI002FCA9EC2